MSSDFLSILEQIRQQSINQNENTDYEYNGVKVPRVTQVIQACIHNEGLMYWANSLGLKGLSYQKTLNQAARIGTQCHNNIDHFLDGKEEGISSMMHEARNAYLSYKRWYNDVSTKVPLEVIYHEKTLTCPYYGGTLDGLYKINNKIYLVDYKTSNHVRFNYCLQLAAYMYMLELEGIFIDGCIILQLSKYDISYMEYLLDFDNPIEKQYMQSCKEAFFSMLIWYYNMKSIEQQFKHLEWGN